ncbi:N(4)-(Beta-N-acetylglucosaminyl)-L-asparaginase-like [Dendronephthya gigantea]|uniref:N(4)-(Beta-N-acetylglucosaminyl)-L-asparaginase- like n=1 Tax=Dendronephthya gigantea TaxID=151771 RepID=UPI00106B7456|nr:N(4)-(Beta-N-acetylglucosaminyl)-L-asparaginase-like [Dendronephthya gigantea]
MASRRDVSRVFIKIVLFRLIVFAQPAQLPLVVSTWGPPFFDATKKAWSVIDDGVSTSLDAVEQGCSLCEVQQCDGTVGYGGSPDENGNTTLDAMIMDGDSLDVGSVGCLKNIRGAISVARSVMVHTDHTLLVGEDATQFAKQMGFEEQKMQTNRSLNIWKSWKENNCQPNFWKMVEPDPKKSCGPYKPVKTRLNEEIKDASFATKSNHDTIGMIVINQEGRVAAGTSTNGANHKIPGRVGDSPIVGAGSYADSEVGGAAATGDGDIMMRFLPSYQAVENMRNGMSPTKAAEDAVIRIAKYYPSYSGAIVAANIHGEYGAAAHKWTTFQYSVCSPTLNPHCQHFPVKPVLHRNFTV